MPSTGANDHGLTVFPPKLGVMLRDIAHFPRRDVTSRKQRPFFALSFRNYPAAIRSTSDQCKSCKPYVGGSALVTRFARRAAWLCILSGWRATVHSAPRTACPLIYPFITHVRHKTAVHPMLRARATCTEHSSYGFIRTISAGEYARLNIILRNGDPSRAYAFGPAYLDRSSTHRSLHS